MLDAAVGVVLRGVRRGQQRLATPARHTLPPCPPLPPPDRPPFTSCDTPLSKNEIVGGHYAAGGIDWDGGALGEALGSDEDEGGAFPPPSPSALPPHLLPALPAALPLGLPPGVRPALHHLLPPGGGTATTSPTASRPTIVAPSPSTPKTAVAVGAPSTPAAPRPPYQRRGRRGAAAAAAAEAAAEAEAAATSTQQQQQQRLASALALPPPPPLPPALPQPLPPAEKVVCRQTLQELVQLPPRGAVLAAADDFAGSGAAAAAAMALAGWADARGPQQQRQQQPGAGAGEEEEVLTALELARHARIAANRAYLAGVRLRPSFAWSNQCTISPASMVRE